MAEITAAAVKELREITNLPMMECKKALQEASGDQAKAIEILKEQFKKVQIKRAENETAEGQVFVKVADDGSKAAMVEVACESAPVATGENLSKFGHGLVNYLFAHNVSSIEELLAATGPNGRPFQKDYEDMVNTIREKIVVTRMVKVEGPVAGYVHHDKKTGVLFSATGGNDPILRDVAMHIAALRPSVTLPEQVSADAVKTERDRLTAEAKASGKPDVVIQKMVDGRMNAFYIEQGVLILQPFAKDDTKSVQKALSEKGLTAKNFIRYSIGGSH